jgi:AcrR family transcriptional regulator
MNTTRSYRMDSRRAATEATRERILDAAVDAFLTRWYDEVTLQDVAGAAGVSSQTVINHFGGKEPLFMAVATRLGEQIVARRDTAPAGDVDALIDALVDDYEITGDATIRALALEEKVEPIRPLMAEGRASHRHWVETRFGRPDLLAELVVATDAYTWKLLRRDQGLSRDATRDAMRRTVLALLALEPDTEERER